MENKFIQSMTSQLKKGFPDFSEMSKEEVIAYVKKNYNDDVILRRVVKAIFYAIQQDLFDVLDSGNRPKKEDLERYIPPDPLKKENMVLEKTVDILAERVIRVEQRSSGTTPSKESLVERTKEEAGKRVRRELIEKGIDEEEKPKKKNSRLPDPDSIVEFRILEGKIQYDTKNYIFEFIPNQAMENMFSDVKHRKSSKLVEALEKRFYNMIKTLYKLCK